VPVEQRNSIKSSEARRNRNAPEVPGRAAITPTDRSLPALQRTASQAGRRRFDPGRQELTATRGIAFENWPFSTVGPQAALVGCGCGRLGNDAPYGRLGWPTEFQRSL